ncbi:hypothetical protein BpHYR1_005808 [Brachionus plicatilis]|uniref:Uncharacterized protein n=1 Tax=Brachionus plicatilis TaxID=10195 RepID=A0A3M7QF19_BRAPC|nr:hypothetical protein BpHYR1_005808 [Brachionus plicatilis]
MANLLKISFKQIAFKKKKRQKKNKKNIRKEDSSKHNLMESDRPSLEEFRKNIKLLKVENFQNLENIRDVTTISCDNYICSWERSFQLTITSLQEIQIIPLRIILLAGDKTIRFNFCLIKNEFLCFNSFGREKFIKKKDRIVKPYWLFRNDLRAYFEYELKKKLSSIVEFKLERMTDAIFFLNKI